MRLAWPTCVAMLSLSVMNLVDAAIVSTRGEAALGGVGLATNLVYPLFLFGFGLMRGLKVVVSHARGAGRHDQLESLASGGLLLALALGVAMLGLGQFLVWLVPVLAPSAAVTGQAASYLSIRLLGAPMVLLHASTREYCYGLSLSRGPMVVAFVANLVNLILACLFVIVMEMGTGGAAWASTVAVTLRWDFSWPSCTGPA